MEYLARDIEDRSQSFQHMNYSLRQLLLNHFYQRFQMYTIVHRVHIVFHCSTPTHESSNLSIETISKKEFIFTSNPLELRSSMSVTAR